MDATVLALVASGIFLVRLLPQPLRLARTGVAEGVSPLAALSAVIVTTAWLVYGLEVGLVVVWAVSVIALVPGLWTVALLARRVTRRDALAAIGLIVVGIAAWWFGVLGAALAVGVLVSSGPQVWRALREADLRGIAAATWWVAIADALSWGAYGLVVHDRAIQGYCVMLLACASTVLIRLRSVRRPALAAG